MINFQTKRTDFSKSVMGAIGPGVYMVEKDDAKKARTELGKMSKSLKFQKNRNKNVRCFRCSLARRLRNPNFNRNAAQVLLRPQENDPDWVLHSRHRHERTHHPYSATTIRKKTERRKRRSHPISPRKTNKCNPIVIINK